MTNTSYNGYTRINYHENANKVKCARIQLIEIESPLRFFMMQHFCSSNHKGEQKLNILSGPCREIFFRGIDTILLLFLSLKSLILLFGKSKYDV